jgi:hypothetical protein
MLRQGMLVSPNSSNTVAEKLSAYWLFPGLLLTMVLGNQPWPLAQAISQLAGWLCIATSTYILAAKSRYMIWIYGLLIGIVAAKSLRIMTGTGAAEATYICMINVLYCFAGAVLVHGQRELIYRQVMVVCLLNLVVMILQVAGAGAWTQLFTTHGEGNLTSPTPTLFVPEDQLVYQLVQGRPAGILYSNIILALVVIFGMVLHFSRRKAPFWGWTTVLCAIIVLCMSKAAFISFGFTVIWMVLVGRWRQKALVLKAAILVAVFLIIYGFFFPGLLAVNLGLETITTSFYLRANDIMAGLSPESPLSKFDGYLEGTPRASWAEEGEHVSGYTVFLEKISLFRIAFILVLGAGFYICGLRRLRRSHPPDTLFHESKHQMILAFLLLGAYPLSFPIWSTNVYWFMMGLALLPFIGLFHPQFIAATRQDRSAAPEPVLALS